MSEEICDGQHYGCPECYKIKLQTVQFEKLDERSVNVRNRDKQFALDNAAYRRLRADGQQPRGVDHSAMAEKMATHTTEIMLGKSLTKKAQKAVTREIGVL